MGLGRLELPTSRLSGVRSDHLSYRPPGMVKAPECSRPRLRDRGSRPRLKTSVQTPGRLRTHPSGGPRIDVEEKRRRRRRRSSPGRRVQPAGKHCPSPARPGGEVNDPAGSRPVLRKEVIQPQVPLRLPCYDFTPVADLTVVGCLPIPKNRVSAPASGKANSHGVTGGVYKARERIHRGMLIRDY